MKTESLKVDDKLPQGMIKTWNIPKQWAWLTLNDIAEWGSGGTPKSSQSEYYGGDISWLIIADLNDGVVTKSAKTITELGLKNSSAKLVDKGSILIAMYGSIGKLGIAGIECTTNQAIAFTKSILEEVETKYLFYYLRRIRQELLDVGKGGTQANISQTVLKQVEIPIAPLNEQKRIVAKLEKLLAKVNESCDRLSRIPTILKRFRQSVLASACSGRLTADWRKSHPNIEPAEKLLKRIQEARIRRYEEECTKAKAEGRRKTKVIEFDNNEINNDYVYSIPETWTWSYFENLGELSRGKSKHRPRNAPELFGGDYPFIQTGDIAQSNIYITSHRQTYSDVGLAQSRLFPENTLCITIAANIADTAILSYPACFPDSVVGFIPEQGLFKVLFALCYVKTIQNDLETFAPATAQKNINLKILNTIPVPVPPLEEQKEIVKRVKALFKKCDLIEQRYLKAKAYTDKLTQSILAKAFRGELVPQDSNDEPAEVLLERIREEKTLTEKSSKSKKTIDRKTT
ncbi:type I restriction-modification system [Geminocystis sp. NIES-3708]|uniref:restriction endonuclease subunit S n=1 Tax=Geminocystis sp. NIES-3708 TaxID=1615909 RepID=UPI0005FC9BB7|nr:restriction endonuclease subunit S [Geminocystis sp. NIES-3708]BAQ60386.1 type I restriction-modification system [Geminocystis sp. NIES-3708]